VCVCACVCVCVCVCEHEYMCGCECRLETGIYQSTRHVILESKDFRDKFQLTSTMGLPAAAGCAINFSAST